MKLKIFLDLDGVCYNWSKSANKVFNINPDDQENRKILKTYHDALEMLVNKHDVYNKIENLGFEFWENLELFPWANALYESLTEIGNVTILTSPGSWTYAGRGKYLALKRDFGINNFILAKKKEICASPDAILIDDKNKNIMRFREAGGWGYLWPNSYCIEDNQPNQDVAISDCLDYVVKIRNKILDRKIPEILNMLSHDNNREEKLIEN